MKISLYENSKFSGTIDSGFIWDEKSKARMQNAKALEPYGYKVYSQNDEDGIIHEIFKRIGTTNKKFIEFGVQDGLESNCHLLLFYGWSGLWIEGSEKFYGQINIKFKPVIENGQLKVKNAFITKENINELFTEMGFCGEIDLLSIDIDGNDWYVWKAINTINPRAVVVEYNGKFPPDLAWKQAYNSKHMWNGTDWHGASLKMFEKLGREKGYQLVGTNLTGCNAFFVRNDLVGDLFYEPALSEELYNPLRLGLRFIANHPAGYCLAVQKDTLGILNYQNYELLSGFHMEEWNTQEGHVWTSALSSCFRILVGEGKEIEIPISIPEEILSRGKFEIEIIGQEVGNNKFTLSAQYNVCRLFINRMIYRSSILELMIRVPYTWRPCDCLDSTDSRSLGIDINLTGIKIF